MDKSKIVYKETNIMFVSVLCMLEQKYADSWILDVLELIQGDCANQGDIVSYWG